MTITKLNADKCPTCGTLLNAATPNTPGTKPKSGDYSICVECYSFLEYDENLKLLLINIQEMDSNLKEELTEMKNRLILWKEASRTHKPSFVRLH